MSQKITPALWFNYNLDEALEFYTSVFKDSEILSTSRYGADGPGPAGALWSATFRLNGQEFMGINAGPMFSFTEAVSFAIDCANQEEVDYYPADGWRRAEPVRLAQGPVWPFLAGRPLRARPPVAG